jgi:hypothetical protein
MTISMVDPVAREFVIVIAVRQPFIRHKHQQSLS